MNKNYIIGGIIVVIILAVGIYFQIQDNNRTNKQLPNLTNLGLGPQNSATSTTPAPTPSSAPTTEATSSTQTIKTVVLKPGSGPAAQNGDKVAVNYIGKLENGTMFDANNSTSSPLTFTLGAGQVIKGWDEGVLGMKVGEEIQLTIPPDLAYGSTGVPGTIPPNSTLIFTITLLSINGK